MSAVADAVATRLLPSLLWPLRLATLAARVVVDIPHAPLRDTVLLSVRLLLRSLPVVVVVTFFAGAMLTVQAASSMARFGAASMAGLVVGFGGVREVFPLLAAGALAARSGAEIASQLQAMRSTRQVEALEVMGLSPMRLLVVPRVIACLLGGPVCVLASMLSGLCGGFVVGVFQLQIDRGAMWSTLLATLSPIDVVVGVGKGVVLGFLVGLVAGLEGTVSTSPGAAAVGAAANRAVVRGMVVVCMTALLLSLLIAGQLGPR
jgi:phospholipid/cholesterol/gamma-HCH transport system permease protein